LRWAIERGFAIKPKSKSVKKLKDYFDILDFSLTPEEMEAISKLNINHSYIKPPIDIIFNY